MGPSWASLGPTCGQDGLPRGLRTRKYWVWKRSRLKWSRWVSSFKNQCERYLGQLILASNWSQIGSKLGQVGTSWGQIRKSLGQVERTWSQVGLIWPKLGQEEHTNMEPRSRKIEPRSCQNIEDLGALRHSGRVGGVSGNLLGRKVQEDSESRV